MAAQERREAAGCLPHVNQEGARPAVTPVSRLGYVSVSMQKSVMNWYNYLFTKQNTLV